MVLVLRERGAVRPHARRYRGSLALSPVPAWLAMSYPAPLRSTPSASRRETRRHFVPSRSLLGRSRRSAPLRGRWCHRYSRVQASSPLATGLLMPRARGRARGTPSPPLAPSDSAPGWTPGLARCGAGPRRLCSHAGRVLRFRRPPGGGRRASSLNASDARRRIAPDGRFPCSESASRRLFLAASGLAAVGGLAVLNVRPRRHAPCLALFHPLARDARLRPSARRTLAAFRRLAETPHSQNGFVSELRRALRKKREAEELAEASGYAARPAAQVHAYGTGPETATRTPHRFALRSYAVAFQSLDGLGRDPSKHRKAVEVQFIDPARLSA